MIDNRSSALQYARDNRTRFTSELVDFLCIPSISTSVDHQPSMKQAAEWLANHLSMLDFSNINIYSTPQHPIVFAQNIVNRKAPTILVYGHYDVQPPDPIDLWTTPPFEPTIRNNNLYARGSSDMKGQIVACLKAIESVKKSGDIPVNIKFIIEGEEEIGSPSMGDFLKSHIDILKSDIALNIDSGMISPDIPTITYALRGLAYFEVRVYGPEHDLHSGIFGGIVHNPAQVLCELISGMHNSNGQITLPGFYDRVRVLNSQERDEFSRLPMDEKYYLEQIKSPGLWGENGYTPIERVTARPTLEVNGLLSGFTGSGSKTVIPSSAMAKISMRLVPDQVPDEVHQMLIKYLSDHAPLTVRWEVIPFQGAPACISQLDTPLAKAFFNALNEVWGVSPILKREGGSIPVVAEMQKYLGLESIISGFGLPNDNIHAPDEKINLPTWYKGIDALIHYIYNLGNL